MVGKFIGIAASSVQKHRATNFESGDYIDCGGTTQLNFAANAAFSNTVWFRTTNAANAGVFFLRRDAGPSFNGYATSIQTTGVLRFNIVHDANAVQRALVDTTTSWNNGNWHHVAFTYDGSLNASGIKIYVDGASQSLSIGNNTLISDITGTRNSYIGRDVPSGTSTYIGDLDDIAIYNKELTAGEVTSIYGSGNPPDLRVVGPTANLVGYWRMGEGATFPTIPDDSSNSNNGTMTNMAATNFFDYIP